MKDYNTRNNEENFPDGTVKAQDGKFFLMENGNRLLSQLALIFPNFPLM